VSRSAFARCAARSAFSTSAPTIGAIPRQPLDPRDALGLRAQLFVKHDVCQISAAALRVFVLRSLS